MKEKRNNLSSNILQSQINNFISNINNKIITSSNQVKCNLNTNGFLEILDGAIKCSGKESLESIIPTEGDLSIKQNDGFSFFVWIYLFKYNNKKENNENINEEKNIYYIFHKGSSIDEFTPSMGVTTVPEKHLVVEITTTFSKKVILLTNKNIEENNLYSFGISFEVNYEQNFTEINMYINGKLDTQTRIKGQPIHNQGNVYFGKNAVINKCFKGVVADLMIMPSVLNDKEINYAHNEGLKNLYESNSEKLDMKSVFTEIFQKKRLINKYAFYTGKNVLEIENLGLSNSKMLEIVKNYDEEEKQNDIKEEKVKINIKYEKMIEEMSKFLGNEDQRILCNKIDMNRKLIHTCFYLANQGEENLEIDRVINIFETLKEILNFEIKEDFIIKLGKILYSLIEKEDAKEKYLLITTKFFENLHKALDDFEEKEKLKENDNEKYTPLKKNKKIKNENLNYLLRRNDDDIIKPLSPDKIKGFGNCAEEHEKLLLNNGVLKNYLEEKQEENLKNFNSMVRIKDLYDIPKNLPGEDEERPNVEIITSTNSSKIPNNIDDKNNNKININNNLANDNNSANNNYNIVNNDTTTMKNNSFNNSELANTSRTNASKKIKKIKLNDKYITQKKLIHNMLLDIMDEEENKVKSPEIGFNSDPATAELIEKDIIKQREEIKKKLEIIKSKKLEEEFNSKKSEKNTPPSPKKEENAFSPSIIPEWSDGSFELVINHCYDCHNHTSTTRHYEYQFIDKFNEIGEAVKSKFPNANIIGNLDEQEYYGNFDVYLCNVGLKSDIKNSNSNNKKDRYLIYSKYITKKFPTVNDILDKLICLVIMYGSSLNLEKSQFASNNNASEINTPRRLLITHEFPAEYSEKAEKIRLKRLEKKPELKIDEERTKFFCTNNGCNKIFVKKGNNPKACKYHPGVYQFGTYNALWPECWTCCEGKWDSPGCKTSEHKGVLLQDRLMLCLNHGELNDKGYPDSVCGTWYSERSNNGCKYHSGHIEKHKYTCCDQSEDAPGCVEGPHETATYPEDKAKLYFYPKSIKNPGLAKKIIPVSQLIKNCEYFKTTKEYPDYKKLKEEADKRKEQELEIPRRCFNIGCNAIFTEKENTFNSCMCHPGHWDFGGTKFKLGFIGEEDDGEEIKREKLYQQEREKKVLIEKELNKKKKKKSRELRVTQVEPCYGKWRPQWTCCGGKWDAEPCTPCFHHGPLLQDESKYNRKYLYPDIRLQFGLRRIVSDRWKEYIQQFIYDEKKVNKICRNFIHKKGKLNLYNIHELFNLLKLKYVIEQEDPSLFLKYRDLSLKQETFACLCEKGNNTIDINKFIKWWFADYMTLYNEIHPLPKREKKDKENDGDNTNNIKY